MRVTCIAPHPDDETLGCGGTLLRHRAEGDRIDWLIVTDAMAPLFAPAFIAARQGQINRVAEAYGFSETVRLALPAAGLDRVPEAEVVALMAQALGRLAPDVVYVCHPGDVHSDHAVVFRGAMAALKPFKAGLKVSRILAYETPSETEQTPAVLPGVFQPNSFVDIDRFIDRKIDIMSVYESECQPYPLPREASAIRALARWRGAALGIPHAEAFALVREAR